MVGRGIIVVVIVSSGAPLQFNLGNNGRQGLVDSGDVAKVPDEDEHGGEEGQDEANGTVLGMEAVANEEQDASKGEQDGGEHHKVILVSGDEGGEDEVVDDEKDALLHAVGQDATERRELVVIASQWIVRTIKHARKHYRRQGDEQWQQSKRLQLKSVNETIWWEMATHIRFDQKILKSEILTNILGQTWHTDQIAMELEEENADGNEQNDAEPKDGQELAAIDLGRLRWDPGLGLASTAGALGLRASCCARRHCLFLRINLFFDQCKTISNAK